MFYHAHSNAPRAASRHNADNSNRFEPALGRTPGSQREFDSYGRRRGSGVLHQRSVPCAARRLVHGAAVAPLAPPRSHREREPGHRAFCRVGGLSKASTMPRACASRCLDLDRGADGIATRDSVALAHLRMEQHRANPHAHRRHNVGRYWPARIQRVSGPQSREWSRSRLASTRSRSALAAECVLFWPISCMRLRRQQCAVRQKRGSASRLACRRRAVQCRASGSPDPTPPSAVSRRAVSASTLLRPSASERATELADRAEMVVRRCHCESSTNDLSILAWTQLSGISAPILPSRSRRAPAAAQGAQLLRTDARPIVHQRTLVISRARVDAQKNELRSARYVLDHSSFLELAADR